MKISKSRTNPNLSNLKGRKCRKSRTKCHPRNWLIPVSHWSSSVSFSHNPVSLDFLKAKSNSVARLFMLADHIWGTPTCEKSHLADCIWLDKTRLAVTNELRLIPLRAWGSGVWRRKLAKNRSLLAVWMGAITEACRARQGREALATGRLVTGPASHGSGQ